MKRPGRVAVHASGADRQKAYRERLKLRNVTDLFSLSPDALRSVVSAQIAERSRDRAALNRLLLTLNIKPID